MINRTSYSKYCVIVIITSTKRYIIDTRTSCTLEIAGNTNQALTLKTTTAEGLDLDIDLTTYNGNNSTDSIKALQAYIDGLAGYTCVWNGIGGTGATALQERANASCLLNVAAGTDIKTGAVTLTTDSTRLIYGEVVRNNQWLESALSYYCTSYAYAANGVDAACAPFMRALDGTSSGQKINIVRAGETSSEVVDLSSFDPVKGLSVQANANLSLSESDLIKRFRDVGLQAVQYGQIFFFYMHAVDWSASSDPDVMTDAEKTTFRLAMQTLLDTGALVMSMKDTQALLASQWSWSSSTKLYTTTLTDLGNYIPKKTSACINAGYNDIWQGTNNAVDYNGVPITNSTGNIVIPGGVDIGAYQYVPVKKSTVVIK